MSKCILGIDYSINSPACCLFFDEGNYEIINVFNTCKVSQAKEFSIRDYMASASGALHHRVNKLPMLHQEFLHTKSPGSPKNIGLSFWHRESVKKLGATTTIFIKLLLQRLERYGISLGDCSANIEYYSYGSKGDASYQLAEITMMMKNMLLGYGLPLEEVYITPGPIWKKQIGNGNGTKEFVYEKFIEMYPDSELAKHLDQYRDDYLDIKTKMVEKTRTKKGVKTVEMVEDRKVDVLSPIDDMLDAFFVARHLSVYRSEM